MCYKIHHRKTQKDVMDNMIYTIIRLICINNTIFVSERQYVKLTIFCRLISYTAKKVTDFMLVSLTVRRIV